MPVVIFFAIDYAKSAQRRDFNIPVTLQRRSRSVETFGQFGGSACQEALGDREQCTTSETCVQPPPPVCTDTEFQCESGTSATQRNRCSRDEISGVTPVLSQVLASRGDCRATETMTARMAQMKIATLHRGPVVPGTFKMMSRGGRQDMGKRNMFKSLWQAEKEAEHT